MLSQTKLFHVIPIVLQKGQPIWVNDNKLISTSPWRLLETAFACSYFRLLNYSIQPECSDDSSNIYP